MDNNVLNPGLTRRKRNLLTLGYYMGYVALGLYTASLGPSLPYLAIQVGQSTESISVLFVARYIGIILGMFVSGRLYDQALGHSIMVCALVMMAALLALVPFIPTIWMLFLIALMLGITAGTMDVGGNTLLAWLHGRNKGPFLNGLHFSYGVGACVAPLLIGLSFLVSTGIKVGYWIMSALILIPVVWLSRFTAPPPQILDSEIGKPSTYANGRLVVLFSLFFFTYVGVEATFGGWIYSYGLARGLTTAANAALITSMFWLSLTLGRLLATVITNKINPETHLRVCLGGCFAGALAIFLWPFSPAVLWVGVLGAGFFMAATVPTTLVYAMQIIPNSGKITGWYLIGGSLGAMFLPWLIGQLIETRGPGAMFETLLVDIGIAFVLLNCLFFISRQLKRRSRATLVGPQ